MPLPPDASDATEVTWVTDRLAITNFVSAHRREVMETHGVKAVLCRDRDLAGGPAADRGLACVRVAPLVDGFNDPAAFRHAVAVLGELLDAHGRVVVHCRAGRSRSIAVVAAHLVEGGEAGVSDAEAALAFVSAKRPAAVAPELARLVRGFEPRRGR